MWVTTHQWIRIRPLCSKLFIFLITMLSSRNQWINSSKDVTIIQARYAHIENLDCLAHSGNRVLWFIVNQSTRLLEWTRQSKFSMCACRGWIMVTSLESCLIFRPPVNVPTQPVYVRPNDNRASAFYIWKTSEKHCFRKISMILHLYLMNERLVFYY